MINFPATCIDDFYDDPDWVRNLALSQQYEAEPNSPYPGKRSPPIHIIDLNFFDVFCQKIFSIFFDLENMPYQLSWFVKTSFQLIPPYDENPDSFKNTGWIHFDDNTVFAGVIYLTPNADLNSGTSLYKLVDETKLEQEGIKLDFYQGKQPKNYEQALKKHNNAYIETVRFNNLYNRMICFDRNTAHGVRNFHTGNEPRLTQVFFVDEITTTAKSPLQRVRDKKIQSNRI